jgi:hypothetical protein
MTMPHLHDILGLCGVVLILTAYLLLQTKRLRAHDLRYSVMNAAGASLVLVSLFFEFNLAAFAIEAFWLLISVFGMVQSCRGRRAIDR